LWWRRSRLSAATFGYLRSRERGYGVGRLGPLPLRSPCCKARTGEDTRGWRALLTAAAEDEVRGHTDDEDEVPGVAVYCPERAEREFG
jgi:hypothetical protein